MSPLYTECGTPPIIGGTFMYLHITYLWVNKSYLLFFKEENYVIHEKKNCLFIKEK